MKQPARKLTLHHETVRRLAALDLAQVAGGGPVETRGPNCPTRRPPCECDCGDSRISDRQTEPI